MFEINGGIAGINRAIDAIQDIQNTKNENVKQVKGLKNRYNWSQDFVWCKIQSTYGNKVLSSSIIVTDCLRYIITFGAITATFKQLIFVYDTKKHITLPSILICPVNPVKPVKQISSINRSINAVISPFIIRTKENEPVHFSAVYMHDFAQDARIINAYIANCYAHNLFESLQYIPTALKALLCKFYMLEFVHLITKSMDPINGAQHHKINLDDVFHNLNYYYQK